MKIQTNVTARTKGNPKLVLLH